MSEGTCDNSDTATLNGHSTRVESSRGLRFHNRNALRHGLSAGRLPPDCGYIAALTNKLRTSLENAVMQKNGKPEISIMQAATIQTVIRHERHCLLCQRWLRLKQDELSVDQLLSFSNSIARTSADRDRSLRTLDLDAPAGTLIDAMFEPHEES